MGLVIALILGGVWGGCLAFILQTLGITEMFFSWQYWALLVCPAILYMYIGYEINRISNGRRQNE